MGIAIDVGAVMRQLGSGRQNPLVARRYRGVLATQHALEKGAEWHWAAQAGESDAIAGILIATGPLRVLGGEGVAVEAPAATLCFLHPHRTVTVTAVAAGSVMCAWVPWGALAEIESGVRAPREVIPPSTLGRGLHAFLSSLLTQHSDPTVYTDYLVERLIAEMVFSVLVEAAPRGIVEGRKASGIDRARSLMLVRRGERDFDVTGLARDMHLSVRQLQRMFAAEGSSPADELRRARVELARELMSDTDYAPLGLAEIAEHAGFADAAGMRRAFALSGLPSPRVVRRTARPGGASALAMQ
ncbi:helix-turn-helix domain-containing protein [Microbacterium azadirachtae]|uniref:AraC family transcriptional regulator n=1 Tax=Microbacterium azadirachtae TaxID=582680 RepID=UPI0021D4897F|nr:helix-turn-helix domain-containing protein [Microbacterium azadirachtae]UXW85192.1 helix-turn-helix domain-containing protein [Microbacterium azadirachtae]